MDGMLLSQYPHTDRASSQLSRDPTVRVPLNTGLRSSPPHLPSLCILSFREPGERVRILPTLQTHSLSYKQVYSCACLDRVCAGGNPSSCWPHKACVMPQKRCMGFTATGHSLGRAVLNWVESRSSLSPMAPGPLEGARAFHPSLGGKDLGALTPVKTRPSCSALVVRKYGGMALDA